MNPTIDLSNVILKTERLVLRPWELSDLDDFYEYARVDGVGQMAGWLPHKDIEETLRILNSFIEGKKTFALEYNEKVIGSLEVKKYNQEELPEFESFACREIGYVLSKDYWGLGLMPEAVNEVIRFLFEEIGLDVIFCSYFVRNSQSARVQKKCGFRFYKQVVHTTRFGTEEITNRNLLRREDWEK